MPTTVEEYDVEMADPTQLPLPLTPQNDMDTCVSSVEQILRYRFRDRRLLEDALTHTHPSGTTSFQRLEFLGDAVLGLAVSNAMFLAYPTLGPGLLTWLRSANISNEKLARVAVRHNLYRYVRYQKGTFAFDSKVLEFAQAVEEEDETMAYGGKVRAPKVLADMVESLIAAVYFDCDYDLKFLWQAISHILEPIVTLESWPGHPMTKLFKLCQERGKNVDIRHWENIDWNICSIYVDGKLIANGTSKQKDTAEFDAAKAALKRLNQSMTHHTGAVYKLNEKNEIKDAKQKLVELCRKFKWSGPNYSMEDETVTHHGGRFVCSVEIEAPEGRLKVQGVERARKKEAEDSAASSMIFRLKYFVYI